MFLQFLICFLMNHLNLSLGIALPLIQMNAAMLAVGLFAFIGLRLHMDARERERRIAAALLIW
jgi:Na+-translocating ferredoxin:NAD+ oxidoreductase RnfA subunit